MTTNSFLNGFRSDSDSASRLYTFVLIDGGPALLFWGLIVCGIGMTCVYASIAELASISPTAGGQYHWVSEFAPRRIQKFLSYFVGQLRQTEILINVLTFLQAGSQPSAGKSISLAFLSCPGVSSKASSPSTWKAMFGTSITVHS